MFLHYKGLFGNFLGLGDRQKVVDLSCLHIPFLCISRLYIVLECCLAEAKGILHGSPGQFKVSAWVLTVFPHLNDHYHRVCIMGIMAKHRKFSEQDMSRWFKLYIGPTLNSKIQLHKYNDLISDSVQFQHNRSCSKPADAENHRNNPVWVQ